MIMNIRIRMLDLFLQFFFCRKIKIKFKVSTDRSTWKLKLFVEFCSLNQFNVDIRTLYFLQAIISQLNYHEFAKIYNIFFFSHQNMLHIFYQ